MKVSETQLKQAFNMKRLLVYWFKEGLKSQAVESTRVTSGATGTGIQILSLRTIFFWVAV